MIILTISFNKRIFTVTLHNESFTKRLQFEDAASNLPNKLDEILIGFDKHQIEKIGFLTGPGSFTSIKVLCSLCEALRLGMPNTLIMPVRLDQAINAMLPSDDNDIFLRCNSTLWHVYSDNEWSVTTDPKPIRLYTAPEAFEDTKLYVQWPDVPNGIYKYIKHCDVAHDIEPLYGVDLFGE